MFCFVFFNFRPSCLCVGPGPRVRRYRAVASTRQRRHFRRRRPNGGVSVARACPHGTPRPDWPTATPLRYGARPKGNTRRSPPFQFVVRGGAPLFVAKRGRARDVFRPKKRNRKRNENNGHDVFRTREKNIADRRRTRFCPPSATVSTGDFFRSAVSFLSRDVRPDIVERSPAFHIVRVRTVLVVDAHVREYSATQRWPSHDSYDLFFACTYT